MGGRERREREESRKTRLPSWGDAKEKEMQEEERTGGRKNMDRRRGNR